MRISVWISDVCSSDLEVVEVQLPDLAREREAPLVRLARIPAQREPRFGIGEAALQRAVAGLRDVGAFDPQAGLDGPVVGGTPGGAQRGFAAALANPHAGARPEIVSAACGENVYQ